MAASTDRFKLRDWLITAPVFAVGFVLSFWGYMVCDTTVCQVHSPFEAFFRALGLLRGSGNFVFGRDPPQLVAGQILLPLSALMTGATLLLQNIRHDVRIAMARRARNHVIVAGLGETGRQVVESFLDAGWGVVAITRDAATFETQACEQRGVAVLEGDAGQLALLRLAGLMHARALVIACGSDASNLEIGLRARAAVEGKRKGRERLKIVPELRTDWLYSTIITHQGATLESRSAEFLPIHLNAIAAHALLALPAFQLPAPPAAPRHPHLLFAGFNAMVSEIISQAVLSNFAVPGLRASITILDPNGEAARAALSAKHPHFEDIFDLTTRTCPFSTEDAAHWTEVDEVILAADPTAVIADLSEDDLTLHTAIILRKRLDRMGKVLTPVFVRLSHQSELGEFLADLETEHVLPDRFTPFGDMAPLTSPATLFDPVRDRLAKATHETHRALARGDSPARAPWDGLPEPVKQSNRAFADHIPVKLRCLGLRMVRGAPRGRRFTEAQAETLARMEHWRWSVGRRAHGWRYGERRNLHRHLHPGMVDWERLGEPAREENRDLVRSIPAIVESAGFGIVEEAVVLGVGDGAAERLAAVPRERQLVVVTDPGDAASLALARTAAAGRGAKVWLVWRDGAWPPPNAAIEADLDALAPVLEAWISEAELAALTPSPPGQGKAAPPSASGEEKTAARVAVGQPSATTRVDGADTATVAPLRSAVPPHEGRD